MPEPESILMTASAGIILFLGLLHLLYTFRGSKLRPRDSGLIESMKAGSLTITSETTVWKAWIGFNASHGMAAILFGLVYGYLALTQATLLFDSVFLQAVGFLMLAGFVVLARLYWFSVPFAAISLSLVCYVAGLYVANA